MIYTIDKYQSSGSLAMGFETGVIDAIVTPVSIPLKSTTLPFHIKRDAFLVHVATEMPLAMDEAGVLEFLEPLFAMQRIGSRNNVLIAFSGENRMTTGDALLAWQLFGGIALPVVDTVQNTLKILDQMLSVPMNGLSGEKRAVLFATNLPYPELDICDEWSLEQVLVYAVMQGELPHTSKQKELFSMSQLDRDVLLEKVKYE